MHSGTPTSLLPTPPPVAASLPLTTSGAGTQDGKTDSRRLGPAVITWDTCQRHSSLTSALICHTHCLWASPRCLIWLADSRRVMAATAEEEEKGLPIHTQDFCRGSWTRIQPLTLHLPQSLLVFNPLLPPPPHTHANSK